MKIVRELEDLNGMGNGNGVTIHVERNFINIRYKGELITSTDKKFFDEDSFAFLNSIGFDFEYKPNRTFEEIMSEVEEVEFKAGAVNACIFYDHRLSKYYLSTKCNIDYHGTKYYDKEQLEKAIEELNK